MSQADKEPRRWYLDDCRDDYNRCYATTCLQTHEDMLKGNSIEVIEASRYDEIKAELERERRKMEKYHEILNWFQINAFNTLDKLQADEFRKELEAIDKEGAK